MLELENKAQEAGFQAVCGIDEAGRGPLAGPVFAAAVILPPGLIIEGLNDSKKLSEKKREELFDVIRRDAAAYGIGMADHKEIDRLNILQATFLAMKRAVEALSRTPDLLLVDGNRDPGLGIETMTIVKGDAKSASIAAASVLAKVSRDRFMLELDREYPAYQFAQHKGYPTKAHYQAIRENGISPVHRKTFLKKMH
ncbi:MAG: ribonuclease HII [Oscillospiraceae bacterium]|nr:ribonuclease HII [Oscillospiraceae bacterium]